MVFFFTPYIPYAVKIFYDKKQALLELNAKITYTNNHLKLLLQAISCKKDIARGYA